MTVKIYGIKNCDTMKKAFDWLSANGVAYDFHDYRAEGIDAATLKAWTKAIGWEKLVNKTSTTFKALPDVDRADLDQAKALKLMKAHPTLIRRPVVEADGQVFAGFKPGSPERAALEAAALKG